MTASFQDIVRRKHTAAVCWTFVAAVVALSVWRDYGTGWDEAVHIQFGEATRQYFAAGFDWSKIETAPFPHLRNYSHAVELAAVTAARLLGADPFVCLHAVTAMCWAATFWPVCALGRRLAGPAGAWLAGCALMGMPAFFGHGFINQKDLPLACAAAWFALTVAWVGGLARPGGRATIALGLSLGFALAVRPAAWFFAFLLGLPAVTAGSLARRRLLVAGAALPLAWVVMVLPWPFAHQQPLANPIEAIRFASSFQWIYRVLFAGREVPSNQLPWSYFLTYFGLTTPLPILLCFLLGHRCLVRRRTDDPAARCAALACAFLCWFPNAAFIALRPNVYDGLRHFLFALPPLAVLAGVGAASLGGRLPASLGRIGRILVPAGVLLAAVPSLFRLHPYQYVYFNALAGPRATLHERFETDYWTTSYREAAQWIRSQTADRPAAEIIVAANEHSFLAFARYARPQAPLLPVMGNYAAAPWPPDAAFYVGTVRYGWWRNFAVAPIVHRVERDGILLSVIRAPAPLAPQQAAE